MCCPPSRALRHQPGRVGRAAEKTVVAPALLSPPSMRPTRRRRRPSEAGIAMVISLFTLMVFIVVCATSTLIARSDIRATRAARGGGHAHLVGQVAVAERLQTGHAGPVV